MARIAARSKHQLAQHIMRSGIMKRRAARHCSNMARGIGMAKHVAAGNTRVARK